VVKPDWACNSADQRPRAAWRGDGSLLSKRLATIATAPPPPSFRLVSRRGLATDASVAPSLRPDADRRCAALAGGVGRSTPDLISDTELWAAKTGWPLASRRAEAVWNGAELVVSPSEAGSDPARALVLPLAVPTAAISASPRDVCDTRSSTP